MILTIENRSSARIPRAFLKTWVERLSVELKKRNIAELKRDELRLIFLSKAQMKKVNKKFRGKAYATDVLSFATDEDLCVGELALCPVVIMKNALEHGLSVREEYAYMVLHGLLHLLGYDHEQSERDAKKMFSLQDSVFKKLLP